MSKEEVCLKLTEIEFRNEHPKQDDVLSSFVWYMKKLYGENENE